MIGLGNGESLIRSSRPSVWHRIRRGVLKFGDSFSQPAENPVQKIRILFQQILNHVSEIAPGLVQALLRTGLWLPPGVLSRQIGYVPTQDKIAQRDHTGILCQLAERIDRKGVGMSSGELLFARLVRLAVHPR